MINTLAIKMFFVMAQNFDQSRIKTETLQVKAKHIYMADFDSEDEILSYHAYDPMTPSSMTKIMTALMAFKALQDKIVRHETTTVVDRYAFKTEGSTMFLNLNQTVRLIDLLRGLICVSGNDAARAIAIMLSGSEQAFAEKMTSFAHKIGATNTVFTNASGLPDESHHTTAYDLFKISHYLIKHFPMEYRFFGERSFCFNGISQPNKNWLLQSPSYDGVKTGHTESGGFGMVASYIDPLTKRRLILVVNGLNSEKERTEETRRLMDWGLRNTKNIYFFKEGETIRNIPVRFGHKTSVDLITNAPVCVTVPMDEKTSPSYEIILNRSYIKGPIPKGTIVGKITVTTKFGCKTYPLKTKDPILKGSLFRIIIDSLKF